LVSPAPALAGYYFAYFAYVGAYSPYFTLYLKDLGLAATQIGVLYAIPQVMRMVGPGVWGALADRTGSGVGILRLAAAAALAAFLGLYGGTGFAAMFAVLVAFHFFTSAQMPLIEAITLDHVRDRPGDYGRIRLWGSVGFIIAVLGLGALLDHQPSRVVLDVTAAMLAATALVAWTIRPAAHAGKSARKGEPLREILARPAVRAFLAAGALNAFAHAALYAFFSIHLATHGYAKTTIGMLWTLGVVIEIAVFRFMPRLMARWDAGVLYRSTFAVCVLRFAIIAFAVDHLWLIVLAQLMHASTFAIYHASAVALVGRHFGVDAQARGQAIYISLSFGLGGFIGGVGSGLLWESLGATTTYCLSAAAGLIGYVLLGRPGQRGTAASR
jgi:PPP family 3-phenylpropionic acid transporter